MKVIVLVKNFQCLQDGVEVFTNEEDALRTFKEYTGFEWNDGYRDPDDEEDRFSEDFSETVIYLDIEIHEELKRKKPQRAGRRNKK